MVALGEVVGMPHPARDPGVAFLLGSAIPVTVSMRMQAALLVECDPPETDARFAVLV